ncbi:MAG TPA: sensor domain-containing phosphodiesterase [Mycobacteriales bacterium]|nr:sensor domain-containing phosphodiesterase [Mycobacteriales bacterium]
MTNPQRQSAQLAGVLLAVMLAAGLWVDAAVLHLFDRPDLAFGGAFVIAAIAFALGEAVVLHVELGKNAHTVSLAELTLAVSLFFVPTMHLPLARIVGGGAVLLLVRRQRPLKVGFNLALWVLDVAVATMVFRELGGGLHSGASGLVVPAVAAAVTSAVVDSLAVNAVIALTSKELEPLRALRFLETCVLNALACGTGAVICVAALAYSAWLLVPMVLVIGLFLLGFHHFAALRAQHTNVKVLYDFSGQLSRTPHGEQVLTTVLSRVGELLRAETAALYLQEADGSTVRLTELDDLGVPHTRWLDKGQVPALLLSSFERAEPLVLGSAVRHPAARHFLQEYGARDAVLAPIQGDQGLRGAMVIANRLGEVTTFSGDDGLLLQTLASHAAAALANSRLVERLDHDSLHDSLTGLANRGKFQERLSRALDAGGTVAVLLMDLDRFKEVNDTLGHHHGDLLLQEIAVRLGREVRGNDVLARLGGDEFAVLMTNLSEAEALETAQRILAALGQPMYLQGVEMEVSASIGVVHIPATGPNRAGLDATLLLQRADVAMYCAKQEYTGAHLYRDELDGYSPRRLALASGLRAAIEQGQLCVRYQPQSRLLDQVLIGAEALVCWDHPLYGEVPPDDFIAIAEQTGQIRELTRFVLDRSLAGCASWEAAGTTLAVSVNLSVRNLLEPDLVHSVRSLLAKHGLPGERLTLEITESHLMSDPPRTAEVLGGLAGLGVRLSIDDFGTGYSSLAYLKQLPVTEIKVDKSFVREIAHDEEDAAIVEAIIQLAHTLRLEVVAEGVEDQGAQDRLADLGCDLFQGYHLARPMRERDFSTWLAARAPYVPRLRAVPSQRDSTPSALAAP